MAGQLGCSAFDAALTGTSWTDRILGSSQTTGTLPLNTVWVATGNNIALEADTARRTLLMRMESPEENPEERDGFQHADLLAWVRSERRRLVVAALTLLRGFVVAGRPDQQLPPWGSFEAWSGLIRNAIVWAGLTDPAETREITRSADRSAELVRLIHAGVLEVGAGHGITTAELIRLVQHPIRPDEPDHYPTLRAAVGELCGAKLDARRLGTELRKYIGRVCCGKQLLRETDAHAKVARWLVVDASGLRGTAGLAGTIPPQTIFVSQPVSDVENIKQFGLPAFPQLPAVPAKPICNHTDPTTWIVRDGIAYCRRCDKYQGRVKGATA